MIFECLYCGEASTQDAWDAETMEIYEDVTFIQEAVASGDENKYTYICPHCGEESYLCDMPPLAETNEDLFEFYMKTDVDYVRKGGDGK